MPFYLIVTKIQSSARKHAIQYTFMCILLKYIIFSNSVITLLANCNCIYEFFQSGFAHGTESTLLRVLNNILYDPSSFRFICHI